MDTTEQTIGDVLLAEAGTYTDHAIERAFQMLDFDEDRLDPDDDLDLQVTVVLDAVLDALADLATLVEAIAGSETVADSDEVLDAPLPTIRQLVTTAEVTAQTRRRLDEKYSR
jgi:hypothetical protein